MEPHGTNDMTVNREPERNTQQAESDPKPGLRHRAWLVAGMILLCTATWIMYLPAKFYDPYCNSEHRYRIGEYYGPYLSTYYRDALIDNLMAGGIAHIEIGDRVLVPFVDPGYLDEHKIGLERLIDYFLGYGEKSWGLTHLKVTNSAVIRYRANHPDSEIARLYNLPHEKMFTENELTANEMQAIWCELTMRIVDPNLK